MGNEVVTQTGDNSPSDSTVSLQVFFQVQLNDLRDMLLVRYNAEQYRVNSQFDSANEAVTKAEIANEKRFESVNEFRAQLADQAGTFMPRQEADVLMNSLEKRLSELTSRMDLSAGAASHAGKTQATIFAIIGAVIGIAGLVSAIVANAQ